MQKIIFIIGGVISSVGKGIITSSLGILLKKQGLSVLLKKIDPYFNVDAGTMDPIQHGEVFCTKDGLETDLDIGHYERFMEEDMTSISSITAGKIFQQVINDERKGRYLGDTVQSIPHITNAIIENILNTSGKKYDLIIVEIGGTIGDIEIQIFLEACRQLRARATCCYILVSFVPYLQTSLEFKSKPTQRSFFELTSSGIFSNFIIFRSNTTLPNTFYEKIAIQTNISKANLFNLPNLESKFEVPLLLHELGFDAKVMDFFHFNKRTPNLVELKKINAIIKHSKKSIRIAIIGKYSNLPDAYISITEACQLAAFSYGYKPIINYISSQNITIQKLTKIGDTVDGVIIPGGFGKEGVKEMLLTLKYCRENKICLLGICLGFQLAVLEYMQNVIHLSSANNEELDPLAQKLVFVSYDENVISNKKAIVGASMILGNQECIIEADSIAASVYQTKTTVERFRHRYIFNTQFSKYIDDDVHANFDIKQVDGAPICFSLKNHPFYVATQFHPEFTSKMIKVHKIFNKFVWKTIIAMEKRSIKHSIGNDNEKI